MTIGAGIALAAIWGFAAACGVSKRVTGIGFVVAIMFAFGATCIVGARP